MATRRLSYGIFKPPPFFVIDDDVPVDRKALRYQELLEACLRVPLNSVSLGLGYVPSKTEVEVVPSKYLKGMAVLMAGGRPIAAISDSHYSMDKDGHWKHLSETIRRAIDGKKIVVFSCDSFESAQIVD